MLHYLQLHWLAVNGRTELLCETLQHITSIDVEVRNTKHFA